MSSRILEIRLLLLEYRIFILLNLLVHVLRNIMAARPRNFEEAFGTPERGDEAADDTIRLHCGGVALHSE